MEEGLAKVFASPVTLLTLVGVLALLVVLLHTRKVKLSAHQLSSCGFMLALTLVLSVFPLYRMPYGGTITLGGMLPIMLVAFAFGPEVGVLAGFAYGILNLLLNPYILHPVQVLFDYPLPFMALGVCGPDAVLLPFCVRSGVFCQLCAGGDVPGGVLPVGQRAVSAAGSGHLSAAVPGAAHGALYRAAPEAPVKNFTFFV